jgi:hypothetical protein
VTEEHDSGEALRDLRRPQGVLIQLHAHRVAGGRRSRDVARGAVVAQVALAVLRAAQEAFGESVWPVSPVLCEHVDGRLIPPAEDPGRAPL